MTTRDRDDLAAAIYATAHITGEFVLRSGATSNEYFDGFASRWAQAYRDEIEDFADCVRTGRDVRVDIGDGREALKIGLAARASIAEGRPMPVTRG